MRIRVAKLDTDREPKRGGEWLGKRRGVICFVNQLPQLDHFRRMGGGGAICAPVEHGEAGLGTMSRRDWLGSHVSPAKYGLHR